MTGEALVARALANRVNAYAPYSKFHVGAALLGKDGKVYDGCNVESAAFGAGLCAERSAVASAVAQGCREFAALAVAGGGEELCMPCGVCRQLLWEFAPDLAIYCANEKGDFSRHVLRDLLPHAFGGFSAGMSDG